MPEMTGFRSAKDYPGANAYLTELVSLVQLNLGSRLCRCFCAT